ncbi:MAG: hypothetical protein ACRYG8_18880 [Janthinobacterium lividum]
MTLVAALLLGAPMAAFPALAPEAPHTGVAQLACGPARWEAHTTSVAHGEADELKWTEQLITVRRAAAGPARTILVEKPAKAQAGLQAVVSSWQCLPARSGRVVELWLTCARTDLAGACQGQQEWMRLLSVDGQRLDRAYAPADRRYPALLRKLGLRIDGVSMKDATGE